MKAGRSRNTMALHGRPGKPKAPRRPVEPTMPAAFWRNRHAILERMDHMEDVSRWALANPEVRMARVVKAQPVRRRLLVPTDPFVIGKNRILGPDGKPLAAPR